ncbi:MAG: chorismate synthase [candidate division Zixibacteria bacterium]|nr:chorismate synthase [candidate division Zixibacteria bacterium]
MLTYLTSGESHGPQLTAIIDGLPAGLAINPDALNFQLSRRQKGYGRGGRMKIEHDQAEIASGVRGGLTMGGPITLVIKNGDWVNWTEIMDPLAPVGKSLGLKQKRLVEHTVRPRPGHADLPGGIKWDHHDLRNVLERASARETAARVAVGSLARQLLEHFEIDIFSHVVSVGAVSLPKGYVLPPMKKLRSITEESDVRCVDSATAVKMISAIRTAKKKSDSLGGVAELIVSGLPAGLGGLSQWYHRLDGQLASALMSVHSVKGVEIGLGFEAAKRTGSQVHDQIYYDLKKHPRQKGFFRKTNNAGGLEGGITNGEDLVIRVAGKPISTLTQPLRTVDVVTKKSAEAMVERTDTCVVPALGVVCEAVASLVCAEAFLAKFGSDNMRETERNFRSFLKADY